MLILLGGITPEAITPEDHDFFERQIRPLFANHCYQCHGGQKQEAGLRLDVRAAAIQGGDSGPLINHEAPDQSKLLGVVSYQNDLQMPPDGKLKTDELAALDAWVRRGAPWPDDAIIATPDATKAAAGDRRNHWAFQPVVEPVAPQPRDAAWVRTPVDAFILAKLDAAGLTPSAPASRQQLLRRVTFNLTGLPPTYDETIAFENDASPDAWKNVVERLLASPRYGERWGRHWLDVARYSDTKGYVGVDAGDLERRELPFAFTYRDWVINAFNSDLPYDQFLKQQIAADVMDRQGDDNGLNALGLFRLGRVFLDNEADQIDDRIDVLMRGMQGLTVACARCHDHKFDPIPTADYYSLYGVFASTQYSDDAEHKRMMLADKPEPHDIGIFKRGNSGNRTEPVPRRYLEVLSPVDRPRFTQGSGRLELASAIASPTNPLTARVWVNRVWAEHFGRGLVASTSDFGVRTPSPPQRELLDYLAARFVADGWSTKQLHRAILLSNTYQQASAARDDCQTADPDNELWWHVPRRRLDFEAFRDNMLATAGTIDLAMHGPNVEISAPPWSNRRTVYARIDRQNLPGVFRVFDFANPDSHSPGRLGTIVPQQGLFLLNSPFVAECAKMLAAKLADYPSEDPATHVDLLYRTAFSRQPTADEIAAGVAFFEATEHPQNRWLPLCHAMVMTNEFLCVD